MSIDRIKRVNELLHREIGAALHHILAKDEVDLSSVTVTHVVTSRNLRQARVLVSVFGQSAERDTILRVLRRRRTEIQEYVHRTVVLKYTPRLKFEIDTSIERGDHVLNILDDLDIPPTQTDPDPEQSN